MEDVLTTPIRKQVSLAFGQWKSKIEWAKEYNKTRKFITYHLKMGMSLEDILTMSPKTIIGQTLRAGTVISKTDKKDSNNFSYYEAICSQCRKTFYATSHQLHENQSCGCLRENHMNNYGKRRIQYTRIEDAACMKMKLLEIHERIKEQAQ